MLFSRSFPPSPLSHPPPPKPNAPNPPDWPLRRAFPGLACLSKARPCKPGSHAYDEKVAADIWDVSADFAGLPKSPQL